jgi:leucine dehydrogenase
VARELEDVEMIFNHPAQDGHEHLNFFQNKHDGLRCIVAIHDTTLGPAIGGCRMWQYLPESSIAAEMNEHQLAVWAEKAAFTDALRLSRGMTYKAAVAGLDHGGGKAIIIGNPETDKTEELFCALGRAVNRLGGWYHTGEDVRICAKDMDIARQETSFVLGCSSASGDPSPVTARGVLRGIQVAVQCAFGSNDLEGRTVAIQGIGHVGYLLARGLTELGARLFIADIDQTRCELVADELGAEPVCCSEILFQEVDILAPCALGGIINDASIKRLRCKVVAGAANNQLLEPRHGSILHALGILYVPDYWLNSGGVINVADELMAGGYNPARVEERLTTTMFGLGELFSRSRREGISPSILADRIAEERIEKARREKAERRADMRKVMKEGSLTRAVV